MARSEQTAFALINVLVLGALVVLTLLARPLIGGFAIALAAAVVVIWIGLLLLGSTRATEPRASKRRSGDA